MACAVPGISPASPDPGTHPAALRNLSANYFILIPCRFAGNESISEQVEQSQDMDFPLKQSTRTLRIAIIVSMLSSGKFSTLINNSFNFLILFRGTLLV